MSQTQKDDLAFRFTKEERDAIQNAILLLVASCATTNRTEDKLRQIIATVSHIEAIINEGWRNCLTQDD